jgi:hypothetical protein
MDRGAQAAHGFDDRIEKPEKDQAEIVSLEQQALGAARSAVWFG